MAHGVVTYSCYLPVLTQFMTLPLPIHSITQLNLIVKPFFKCFTDHSVLSEKMSF